MRSRSWSMLRLMMADTSIQPPALITVIGGRIIPVFTRNRLRAEGRSSLPREQDWRDHLAIAASATVALAELVAPAATAAFALAAAALHALRLWGWRGSRVTHDPLLFILHVGYGWLVVGYGMLALAMLGPAWDDPWNLHGLLAGAVGTMTLAVMSRAILGHTGRPVRAVILLACAFIVVQGAAVVRLLAPVFGPAAWQLAGALWIIAFGIFLLRCGPMLVRPGHNL